MTAGALRAQLAGVLAGLPQGERDVIVLIAWEQLTYDEVARALSLPIGTIRSRLNRVRTRLRTALAQAGLSETIEEILSHG